MIVDGYVTQDVPKFVKKRLEKNKKVLTKTCSKMIRLSIYVTMKIQNLILKKYTTIMQFGMQAYLTNIYK